MVKRIPGEVDGKETRYVREDGGKETPFKRICTSKKGMGCYF